MSQVRSAAAVVAGSVLILALVGACSTARDWRNASSEPAGLAPDPASEREALVQVYAARTWGWRGLFGSLPELIAEKRGTGVDAIIERIDRAAVGYPYTDRYAAWPGPNSNTFTAWVLRVVPELRADLPPTAIGKDYLGEDIVSSAPSGSGYQFTLLGLFGMAASGVEGVEVNVLGLTFGINPFDLSLKLPLVGRIGPERLVDTVVAAQ